MQEGFFLCYDHYPCQTDKKGTRYPGYKRWRLEDQFNHQGTELARGFCRSHGPRLGTLPQHAGRRDGSSQDKQISLQNNKDHILLITKETVTSTSKGVTHSAAQRWGFAVRSQWLAVLQLSHSGFSPPDLNQEDRLILLSEDSSTEAVLFVTKASMRRWTAEERSTITGSASHKFPVLVSQIRCGVFSQQLGLFAFF